MTEQKPTREGVIRAWKDLDAKSDKPVGQKEVARARSRSLKSKFSSEAMLSSSPFTRGLSFQQKKE